MEKKLNTKLNIYNYIIYLNNKFIPAILNNFRNKIFLLHSTNSFNSRKGFIFLFSLNNIAQKFSQLKND